MRNEVEITAYGGHLLNLREACLMTQHQAARLLDLHESTYSQYECGRTYPREPRRSELMRKMVEYLMEVQ